MSGVRRPSPTAVGGLRPCAGAPGSTRDRVRLRTTTAANRGVVTQLIPGAPSAKNSDISALEGADVRVGDTATFLC